MAKRLTDTEKWKKSFIRSLQAPYKLLWLYILDECNHAGIWEVEIDVAKARIGENLDLETAVKQYGDRIQVFDGGKKWFIPDFLDFQYGQLQEDNRVHKSVFAVLGRYGLSQNKPLDSSLQGAKDKDKDLDKDKVKVKDQAKDDLELKIEACYLAYPTKRPDGSSTGKSQADKAKIRRILTDGKYDLLAGIEFHKKTALNGAVKNLKTFLNNLPDLEARPPVVKPAAPKARRHDWIQQDGFGTICTFCGASPPADGKETVCVIRDVESRPVEEA